MTMLSPLDNEELYNSIVLAGRRSPGVVTLSGHDRTVGWDIKNGSGQAGATMTRKGEEPVEFTATFYLADREDFAAWPAFQALIDSTVSGLKPQALDVYHPDLAANRISSVVKKSIAGVVHDGMGGQTIVVKLIEYRPPKPAGGSPSGSKAKKPAGPDPNADVKAELAGLTKQLEDTKRG